MSRSQIRRVAAALILAAVLVPALPARAEATETSAGALAGIVNLWNEIWEWAFGAQKGPRDLPVQAQGRGLDTDQDKGSGIDPNGGNGNSNGQGNGNGNSQ